MCRNLGDIYYALIHLTYFYVQKFVHISCVFAEQKDREGCKLIKLTQTDVYLLMSKI